MSISETRQADQTRIYDRASSIVFLKTDAPFGGLSNMAGGYPLRVNGISILTSEALYQACRFPHHPEVQRLIIEQRSPMTAKMKSKPYRHDSRSDWDQVRVKIMRWCLRVKLAQNWLAFSGLLLETGDRPIVEESRKDDFWGAKAKDDGTLVGMNVLGRLLMELRQAVQAEGCESLMHVNPLAIPDFLLGGRPIGIVGTEVEERGVAAAPAAAMKVHGEVGDQVGRQPSLFDGLAVEEAPSPIYLAVGAPRVRIADLGPYLAYKNSGLPWLGKVPAHWDLRPAFGAFVPNHERNHGMKEKAVLSLSYGRIVIKPTEKLHGLVPESFETYQIVNPSDIVLRTTDLQNDHTSLRVGIVRNRGIITSAYLALRVGAGVNPEFGFQFLNVWDTSKAIYGYGSGLRQNLDFSHFKRMPVALPPPAEQAAVVRFLDWVNGRMERTIRAKRKVITLLNEQKQAIIQRAVTRGLDPAIPLKASGSSWLGDVPQHWETLQVRRVASFVTSGSRGWASYYSDDGLIFLQSGNLGQSMSLKLSSIQYVRPPDGAEGARTRVQTNDVLVCITGALTGNVAFVDRELCAPAFVNQHVALVRPKQSLVQPRFLAYVLHSEVGRAQFKTNEHGGTKQGLGLGDVRSVVVAIPSLEEQQAICMYLDDEIARFLDAIARRQREIEFLREYRTRLVADVVTGKLDVREAASRLPAEDGLPGTDELADDLVSEAEEAEA